jgi:ABC-type lipoprotein release transport system permease subunit
MRVYLRVAWRNILANRRRTALSVLIIVVGTALTVFMWAMQEGAWDMALQHITDLFTGQVQIERAGFSDDYDVRKVIADTGLVFSRLRSDPDVLGFAPRLMATGMASSPTGSACALIVGINPDIEPSVSKLAEYTRVGEFLRAGDFRGAVIGDRIAEDLGLRIGDKMVIMAMDSSGNIAGEALRVRGLLHLGSAELDRSLVLVNAGTLRNMLLLNGYHTVAVRLKDLGRADEVAERLSLGGGVVARSWRDFMPALEQTVRMKRGSVSLILLLFLLLSVSAIASTMLMSVKQRVREFGIMHALGMKPQGIFLMVITEGILLSAVGVIAGLVLGFLITWIFSLTSIYVGGFGEVYETYSMGTIDRLYPRLGPLFWSHLHEPIVGFILVAVLSSFYPAYIASRMTPMRAMRYY